MIMGPAATARVRLLRRLLDARRNPLFLSPPSLLCCHGRHQNVTLEQCDIDRHDEAFVGVHESVALSFWSDESGHVHVPQGEEGSTDVLARDFELPVEAARARTTVKVNSPPIALSLGILDLKDRPSVPANSKRSCLLDGRREHLANSLGEGVPRGRSILLTPLLKNDVEFHDERGEEGNRVLETRLVKPLVHRLGNV